MLLISFIFTSEGFSITLDEAIKKATAGSYLLKEQKELVKKTQFSYISSIDPYLPKFTLSGTYDRNIGGRRSTTSSTTSPSSIIEPSLGRDTFSTGGALSYRLFDGGLRYAQRQAAHWLVGREKERLEEIRTEVIYSVKAAFYTALGKRDMVQKRQEAYEATKRIYELTKARFDEGLVKRSDLLQSEVRATTTKIELVDAIKEYEKSLEDLKSLLLIPIEEKEGVEGELSPPGFMESYEVLIDNAIKRRPDIAYQTLEIKRIEMTYKEKRSEWFPKIDATLQQSRYSSNFFPEGRQDAFILNFTFPLFDGVGRYYNMEGILKEVNAAKYRLEEIMRTARLEVIKGYKDYELSLENVRMYSELLREAKANFDQAFGEYKVGKGDILTLLQAERDLAKAKENLISALYQSNNALAFLEKVSYLDQGGSPRDIE
jgi:outer membrane protein TolC